MHSVVLFKMLQKMPVLAAKTKPYSRLYQQTAGFTIIEVLVVAVMVGVLAAIAAPSWIGFTKRQQANKANDAILGALQEAQREAKKRKLSYSVSFRTDNNIPQIAIHPKDSATTNFWRNLGEDLGIQSGQIVLGTNLTNINTTTSSSSLSYASAFNSSTPQTITFDYTGALDLLVKTKTDGLTAVQNSKIGDKGLKIAVAVAKPGDPTQASDVKRCVIVKTLLGSIKTGKDTDCN